SRALESINETSTQKAAKRRRLNQKDKDVKEIKKHLEIMPDEDDDVYTEATPLARKAMFGRPDGQDNVWKSQRSVHGQAMDLTVAQGHIQEEDIDYDEVFTPVARIEAIRLFLAYASFKNFVVYQMDVKSAFLYEKIKEEVYVCQPSGFEDPDFPDKVYKVETALYGLHQALRAWRDLQLADEDGWGDSLVRATTTAESLEAEQDSGNINKTQTKATSNELSSQGTSLGDGPRCQDTIGDTSTHTRYERLSKMSIDSLLAGVNTPQSDEDILKHIELMKNCTTLQKKVLDLKDELKRTKIAQQSNIDGLERRVKKLKKKHRSRTHKLKRLYKVNLTAKVISSSDDEALDREDTSKQGRIEEIDADKNIALMLIDTVVDVAQVTTAIDDVSVSAAEAIVTTALTITAESIKINVKVTQASKRKGVMIQEPEETTTTKTVSLQQSQVQDKGKGKAKLIKEHVKLKKKYQILFDEEVARKLQEEIYKQERLVGERARQEEEANNALIET
nr:putative ribonuclease H-like domain-containing protein [Tanacetum cinerariifolium]